MSRARHDGGYTLMSRMRVVRRAEDCSGSPQDAKELFDLLFPDGGERRLSGAQQGWGLVAAQHPQTAIALIKLTKGIAAGAFLSKRTDLREIAIQAVNLQQKCEFSYRSHLKYLDAVGLSLDTIAALPYWRTSSLFTTEQKLVIEYTLAVLDSRVSDELFKQVADAFGRDAAAELALAIAHWSFWALLSNAARLQIDAP